MRISMAVSHVMFMPFMAWHMHALYICAYVYAVCPHVCAVSVVYVYHHVSVTCAIVLCISCNDCHVTARMVQARAHMCMCTVLIIVVICMCMEQLVGSYSCLHLPNCCLSCMTHDTLYPAGTHTN
jgi:hypothetical protein